MTGELRVRSAGSSASARDTGRTTDRGDDVTRAANRASEAARPSAAPANTASGPADTFGFQVTFFRSATGLAAASPSRFAARQLVFAHAALSDLAGRRLRHDQRIARAGFGVASAAEADTALVLDGWRLSREAAAPVGHYRTQLQSDLAGFAFDFTVTPTQPVLLQGNAGWSRKGGRAEQASFYYSEPQLAVAGRLRVDGRTLDVDGRAWLDHEWSDSLLEAGAVGWDWIGMNLDDGSALTAFRIRDAQGGTRWAGGSFRRAGGSVQDFASGDVRFEPVRRWTSAATRATYPVEWTVDTPAGRFAVKALLDDQELDSRSSTGSVYWEGLSDLLDASGRRVGRGYLEMTGYAAPLAL
ncbi:carotenoid 1,2-hydratase [Schlegelella sp. ID0723]|uniref:Carotenoid 1,2-hydratase n=2 Tax=Piscinibacter koreensis TaxID=2742824 RepID=A0A7Y6NPQ5_9BURK|nr:carotenoid 1,2-hydratase [Schlegelella koreensis]